MTGAEILQRKLDEDRVAMVDTLISGAAKDFADYRHMCGVIRGLDTAYRHITDLAERVKKEDE